MPTYQYACTSCGHKLEAVQSFSDDPLTTCPSCEGKLRKLFSSVGIVFKGSGFYRTDSRKPATSGTGTGNGSSGSTAESSGGSSKAESGSGSKAGASSGAATSDSSSGGAGSSRAPAAKAAA